MELVLNRVSKQYQNKIVVDRVSLRLKPQVIGLLGANGAGKTTLMRMICGVLQPTGGTIRLDGLEASDERYRDILGYLPQNFGYYPSFTGREFLMYMAALKGLDPKERVRFRNLIAELGKDAIVVLSTHIVSDVEHIADRILMMKDGQFIFDGSLDEIGEDLEEFYLENFAEHELDEKTI